MKHKNIVIVSHGGTMRTLLKQIKDYSPDEMFSKKSVQNTEIFSIEIGEPCPSCKGDFYEPDPDTLDTWFSSALWPFATLGWPGKTKDLASFYPTSVLSTARDIINLWVARMVFSGLEFTGRKPFSDVIIHATILTKEGKRMSKSLGTGIDPMTLIEKYGADATRFGLIWQAMGGQDVHWSEEHVNAGKKFANKLWNAARFLGHQRDWVLTHPEVVGVGEKDEKILDALESVKKTVDGHIEAYEFGQALHALYEFFWHEFCDVYIEQSKKEYNDEVFERVLTESLKLLHPFMPFVTEEIWAKISRENSSLLIIEPWPFQNK